MAFLQLPVSSAICCFSRTQKLFPSYPKFCVFSHLNNESKASNHSVIRRSANYKPTIWNHEFLQSLNTQFKEETYLKKIDELKKMVKVMLNKKSHDSEDPLKQLEFIDTLQRLGLSYHFEKDINQILKNLNNRFHDRDNMGWKKNNLYATALEFRILRQHGYSIPQDVFTSFKDDIEDISECACEEKVIEILCLYEASYLAIEGETLLDKMRYFALKYLEKYISLTNNDEEMVSSMVRHALEIPLHWRMSRLETRWFIDIYQRKPDINSILLELAKLDFNVVQFKHQQELKDLSRWWKSIGLAENLSFARDRLISNFILAAGLASEPQFGHCRIMSTKLNLLLTVIDDLYDVYGTLDELQLFTAAIERWDADAIDDLPDYMKICFLAVHNTINDMAFDIFKDQRVNVIKYLKKMWADYCKSLFNEAIWYHTNHKPTFKEYLEKAWITIAGPIILFHTYVFGIRPIKKEVLESLIEYHDIMKYSPIIFRLTNDLTTSSDEGKRGDVLKSVQCYMNDSGSSKEEALKYINQMIIESWRKMNEVGVKNSSYFSPAFIEMVVNFARVSHTFYQHGDGFGVENQEINDHVISLFIKAI